MTYRVLLSLLLALGCAQVRAAPMPQAGLEQGSCEDGSAKAAARLALDKINQDRQEGYVFNLHRLSNVHMAQHGENGMVFYLTLDVVETNCSVLNRDAAKTCESRPTTATPVYGQCKTAIYISKVNRVVRLYKYDCAVSPVPAAELVTLCPDCPSLMDHNNARVQKTIADSLEKFNSESGLAKHFALLHVARAAMSSGMVTIYNVQYAIQETTCARGVVGATAETCPLMDCEFAHKGFCKGSFVRPPFGGPVTNVECELYEPEAADREKKLHLKAEETDHSHSDAQVHAHTADHDHAHTTDSAHTHDHANDHTKVHVHGPHTHTHDDDANAEHHHSHDHDAGSAHRHAHDHSHDHGHGHDHVHAHHAKAHNHSRDAANHHHDYKHAAGSHTHDHDHELALDHDHKHPHLHAHEHHHHHHDHEHEREYHDHPEGKVTMLPSMDMPVTLPFFPVAPEVAVTLPAKQDPAIPGEMEPTIRAFPTAVSGQCPAIPVVEPTLVEKFFAEDPRFKA